MKKITFLIITILLPLIAMADAVEVDGIYYNLITKGNAAEVTSNPNKYTGSVVIPEKFIHESIEYSVTGIGDNAFIDCSNLTSITIPHSVTSIGNEVFAWCTGLTSITIPNSVTSIGYLAFYNCSSLNSISVESGNTVYDSRDNCNAIIETATNSLLYGCNNTTIPNSVTGIRGHAFTGCANLTSIRIPKNLKDVSYSMWHGCPELTSITVESGNSKFDSRDNCNAIIETATNTLINGCKNTTIPNSVTRIEWGAFYKCSGLTSITIPNSVTNIGFESFRYCSDLTSVTIGNNVSFIQDKAFYDCNFSTIISLNPTPPRCNSDVFFNDFTATLYVPQGCVLQYKAANVWRNFVNILEIESDGIIFPKINDSEIGKMISSEGGLLTINGVEDGTLIEVYKLDGTQAGASESKNGSARIYTNLQPGNIAIVKTGKKSVKVVIR